MSSGGRLRRVPLKLSVRETSLAYLVSLMSSKPRVYLLQDGEPVELSASLSVGCSKWAVLIGRTDFDTTTSIPDPTLSSTRETRVGECVEGRHEGSRPRPHHTPGSVSSNACQPAGSLRTSTRTIGAGFTFRVNAGAVARTRLVDSTSVERWFSTRAGKVTPEFTS